MQADTLLLTSAPPDTSKLLKPRQSFYTTRLREHTTSCSSSRAASHETYIVYLCYNVYDQIHRCLFVGLNLRINEMDFYIHVYVD